MKNVTLSIDDEVYRAARIEAAKRNTSMSGLVREALRVIAGISNGKPPSAEETDRKQRLALVQALKKCKLELGFRPTRDKTYAR